MGGSHRLGDGCRRSGVAGYGGPRRCGSVGGGWPRRSSGLQRRHGWDEPMAGWRAVLSAGAARRPIHVAGPVDALSATDAAALCSFTVLPPVLWWAIPLGAIALVIARHRPRPLALGVIALCLVNPTSISTIYWGNPGLWMAAAVALATVYGWPAVLVLLKPTLLPFALLGIRRRSWWLSVSALSVVSFLFLPMWFEYIVVVGNARPPGAFNGLGYSVSQIPLLLVPVAAWLGRTRHQAIDTTRPAQSPATQ